ncbi:UNVERIFIED_CONTAM: hypothetical protein GTU68_057799 [Idotea baltica]|nr:hypothetical protein [Idotea baltica]
MIFSKNRRRVSRVLLITTRRSHQSTSRSKSRRCQLLLFPLPHSAKHSRTHGGQAKAVTNNYTFLPKVNSCCLLASISIRIPFGATFNHKIDHIIRANMCFNFIVISAAIDRGQFIADEVPPPYRQ